MSNYVIRDEVALETNQDAPLVLSPPEIILGICSVLFGGMLFSVGLKLPGLTLIGIVATLLIVMRPEWGVVAVFSIQTWDQIFNPAGETGLAFISLGRVLMCFVIFVYFIRIFPRERFQLERVRSNLWVCFFLILWSGVTILWSFDPHAGFISVLKLSIQIAFVYVALAMIGHSEARFRQLLFWTIIGVGTACIFALFFGGDVIRGEIDQRLKLQGVGVNSFAINIGFAIIVGIGYLIDGKKRFAKILAIVCILFCILTCFRTGTRSVFIGLPFALFFGVVFAYRQKLSRLILALTVIGLLGLIGYELGASIGVVGTRTWDRLLTSTDSNTYMKDERLNIWSNGFYYFKNHPFGSGIGGEEYAFDQIATVANGEAHNTYLSMLFETSVPGFLLLVGFVGMTGKQLLSCRCANLQFLGISVWVYVFLQSMKGTILDVRIFWLPIAVTLLCLEVDRHVSKGLSKQNTQDMEAYPVNKISRRSA